MLGVVSVVLGVVFMVLDGSLTPTKSLSYISDRQRSQRLRGKNNCFVKCDDVTRQFGRGGHILPQWRGAVCEQGYTHRAAQREHGGQA